MAGTTEEIFYSRRLPKATDVLHHIEILDTPTELHSGGKSHVIIDVISMLTDSILRTQILFDMKQELFPFTNELSSSAFTASKEHKVSPTIVGIETGGALLAMAFAAMSEFPYGIYRKDGTLIMPKFKEETLDRPVILVDDVITTGNSLKQAQECLELNGFHVVNSYAVVDRRAIGKKKAYKK